MKAIINAFNEWFDSNESWLHFGILYTGIGIGTLGHSQFTWGYLIFAGIHLAMYKSTKENN